MPFSASEQTFLSTFGIISVMVALIPVVAISPILLYIGMLIMKAAGCALAGAALAFFGFMHGEKIGIAQSLAVAASYLLMSAVLVGCAKYATMTAPSIAEPAQHASASV